MERHAGSRELVADILVIPYLGLEMKNTTFCLSLLLGLLSVSPVCAETQAVADFNLLVDKYFDFDFSFRPTDATAAGFHQYDPKLEDYSAVAHDQQIRGLKKFLAKFEAVDGSKLPADTAADREWIISSIYSDLLELENIQM
jgi:uncharacterized protein (DUF885 family)